MWLGKLTVLDMYPMGLLCFKTSEWGNLGQLLCLNTVNFFIPYIYGINFAFDSVVS